MLAPSPVEIITRSFYAWEVRGRGWQVSDYPVLLEPPFRFCGVLPELGFARTQPLDDGKRPTLLSSFVEKMRETFRGTEEPGDDTPPASEELEPYPVLDTPILTAFRIAVPADFLSRPDTTKRLLTSFSACLFPVSFELIGSGGKVAIQIACAASDREHVRGQLLAYLPDASVIESEDLLASIWHEEHAHAVVDLGLSEEFFLPLQADQKLDPYLSLIPALASAEKDECVLLQVLFQGVQNPWGKAIRDALDDGRGGSVFLDAPDFPRLAEEKLRTPLFAVVLRVSAQAKTEERAWQLARSTGAFFLPFARSGGNELIPLINDGYPDDLHAAAVLRRETFRSGMLLSGEELAALVHLPDASIRHPGLVRDERRTKRLPNEAQGGPHVLGENWHRGESVLVTLSDQERLEHTWIIGASGTGKSTLLLNLILGDIAEGHGMAVLDPHGDLIDDLLARVPDERKADVILFDPSDTDWPVGCNILSAESERERVLLASDVVGIFRRFSTSWGDTMGTVLGNAVLAILEHPRGGTLLDLRRLLVDERFRREYLKEVRDEEVAFFWAKEYPLIGSRSIGPILTRLDTFLRPKAIRHMVGQPDGKLRFSEVMESRKILLAKLSHGLIGEENAHLLGSFLVGKLLGQALSRQEVAKGSRSAFFLYADEFQHFLTPSMETLLTAARKYGLGVTLAHQTLSQLRDMPKVEGALMGNARTRIVFRTGEGDARTLAEGFSFFEASDIRRLGRGEAIVRLGSSERDCNLMTFPAPEIEDEAAEIRRLRLIALSRSRYAVPVEELTAKLREQYGPREREVELLSESAEATEPALQATPPVSVDPIPKEPRRETTLPRTRPAVPPPLGRGGQEHKYLQHLVKRLAEERGFRASIEEAAGEGRADVVLMKEALRVAVEVSVTTDAGHETENLRKCQAAGFERIIFVVSDRKRREKLAARFGETPSVSVIGTDEIVTALDALDAGPTITEGTVRGYKVKVTRQALSPEDVAGKRSAIAAVIARSLSRQKD